MNNELKQKIQNNLFTKCGKIMHETKIRRIYTEIYEELINATTFLPTESSLSERIYCVLNDITERPLCKTCNQKFVNFSKTFRKYYDYCSPKCIANNNNVKENRKNTNIHKYGCSCNLNSEDGIRKKKETWLKKYGVDNPNKSNIIKKNKKQTFLLRYGVETAGQIEEGKKKSKETCLKKYGVEYTGQIKERQEKMKSTMRERYGVDFYLSKTDIDRKSYKRRVSYEIMTNNIFDYPLCSMDDYLTLETHTLKFKCRKCGHEFESEHYNGYHNPCPICFPSNEKSSIGEQELRNYIIELVGKENIRVNYNKLISPYEIDIYIPQKKVAIEYDGLYWHSFPRKDKKYHLMKTEMCEKQGIQLIHIFENEWILKNNIVKSRLKNILTINENKIYGRKCDIVKIDEKEKFNFLEKNHIQGNCASSLNIGLYFNNELVSVMTFGKSRFNKTYEWELLRFCNKLNTSVIGGASKLLKYFEENYNPKSLLSYADRRWSQGKLYETLNFQKIDISSPNYWYWNSHKSRTSIESREKYQKHKLSKILKLYDKEKSELENMMNNGFYRIYDCGNFVFEKMYNINHE